MSIRICRSLRGEIFRSSLILSAIILIVFGFFFIKVLFQLEMSKAIGIIKQRNLAVNIFIDGYFTEIENTIRALAADIDVQNAPILENQKREKILKTYRSYAANNSNIRYIYSGYSNGLLLINDYIPPEGYDLVTRPWYRSAMESGEGIVVGTPYQDIKDGEWLISTGLALPDQKNGRRGVVAIDSSIEAIADLLQERKLDYKSSYSLVLNRAHQVTIHHNEKYLNRPLNDIIKTSASLTDNEGEFNYILDGIEKYAYYSRLDQTGWIVVTVVDKNEIIQPIVWRVLPYLFVIGSISVLIGLLQSVLLSRRFSAPLKALQERLKIIVSGGRYDVSDYRYPDNEIGFIAQKVGQLAEHELYLKARDLNETNQKLQQSIEELKTLRGIIPICSSCKKIRDDKGSWSQLETYIELHSDAKFSHGLCEACSDHMYGGQRWYKKKE